MGAVGVRRQPFLFVSANRGQWDGGARAVDRGNVARRRDAFRHSQRPRQLRSRRAALHARLGQSSVAETVLRASSSGHFFADAALNGVTFPAVIDTGATLVVLNSDQAERMGIDLRQSQRVTTHTANGPAPAYVITLTSVQVGEL